MEWASPPEWATSLRWDVSQLSFIWYFLSHLGGLASCWKWPSVWCGFKFPFYRIHACAVIPKVSHLSGIAHWIVFIWEIMRNIYLTWVGSHRFSSGISPQWAHMKQIILLYRISIASGISPEWDIPLRWDIPPHMKRPLGIQCLFSTICINAKPGAWWPEKGARDHAPKFSRNRRIFGNFDALSEKFLSSAMGKEKGFEFYRRVIELGPLLYMCTTPLCKTEHESYTKMKLWVPLTLSKPYFGLIPPKLSLESFKAPTSNLQKILASFLPPCYLSY